MVTETIPIQIESSVRSDPAAEPNSVLTAELVDDLRKRVEEPASAPAYDHRENLALKLWKYVTTVDDWLGGGPTTQRERDRRAKLESPSIYYDHGLMKIDTPGASWHPPGGAG